MTVAKINRLYLCTTMNSVVPTETGGDCLLGKCAWSLLRSSSQSVLITTVSLVLAGYPPVSVLLGLFQSQHAGLKKGGDTSAFYCQLTVLDWSVWMVSKRKIIAIRLFSMFQLMCIILHVSSASKHLKWVFHVQSQVVVHLKHWAWKQEHMITCTGVNP